VLRLGLLARQPLGIDEDFTAAAVGRPLGEMLGVVSRDSAPPLFYVAEWLVAQVAGGPAPLRLVPVLAGIALVPLLAALARRVGGDGAGLWSAAFAAVLPATLIASENARMYSLAGALVVAATLLLWRAVEGSRVERSAVERPNLRSWVAYCLVAAAAVWTDYFAAVALAGVLVALAALRPGRRALATAGAATANPFAGRGSSSPTPRSSTPGRPSGSRRSAPNRSPAPSASSSPDRRSIPECPAARSWWRSR